MTVLKAEEFENKVGDDVTLSAEGLTVNAFIHQVDRLKDHTGQNKEPYSVVFESDSKDVLEQQTYTLSHKDLAEDIAVFIVPIGEGEKGVRYEAVFN